MNINYIQMSPGSGYRWKLVRSLLLSIIMTCSIVNRSSGSLEESYKDKNVLVIFSLSPNTPAYSLILDGLREKLFRNYGAGFNLYIEYLETERYPEKEYPEKNFELLNHKYKDLKLDLLISVGYNSSVVIRKFAGSHILEVPAISIDFDFSRYTAPVDMTVNAKTTVIGLKWNFEKSLDAIFKLMPEAVNVSIIGGSARLDSVFAGVIRKVAEKYSDQKKINFVSGMSMDQVLLFVHNLPEKSLIVLSLFSNDSRQVSYLYGEAARMITRAANSPVFTLTDTAFGHGEVGGYLLSIEKAGKLTGDVAVQILSGADSTKTILDESEYYDYLFDWRALQKWNISNSNPLPPGSTIMYRKETFLEKYKWYLLAVLSFLTIQSILIVSLVLLNRKQRHMNKLIRESEEMYRKLIREDRMHEMGQITASLSHELNQPLTAILSNAQAGVRFIDSGKNDKELMKEIFLNIVEDDKRASSILSSVRSMMKLETREKEKTDLKKAMTEIVELCRSKITENKCRLELVLPAEPLYILADKIQIQQVLLNLILNANQAMPKTEDGNVIRVKAVKEQDRVSISVIDNGSGIDGTVHEKLFKTFVTSKKDGSGIGLIIARSIIEDHQGKIWAENNPSGGATFSFNLKHCDA